MNSHSSHSPPAFLLFTTHNSSLQFSPGTGIFFVCQGCCSVPDNATYDRWGSVLCDEGIHCLWFHLDQSPLLGNWLLCYELSITNTSVVLEIVYQEKNITFRGVFFFFFWTCCLLRAPQNFRWHYPSGVKKAAIVELTGVCSWLLAARAGINWIFAAVVGHLWG